VTPATGPSHPQFEAFKERALQNPETRAAYEEAQQCPAVIAVGGMVYLCDGAMCAGGGITHGSKRAGAIWTHDKRAAVDKGSSRPDGAE
jgi:hypothetical protein